MKWRSKKGNTGASDAVADPLEMVDAGVKDADELDADDMARVDRELDQGMLPAALNGLTALVQPPSDLPERMVKSIDKKLLGRQTALMCFDLLTTGWHTTRVVMSPEDEE